MRAENRGAKKKMESRKEVIIMPAGDGTGPKGIGPKSGNAARYCAEQQIPGYATPGCDNCMERGQGRGFGRGRGRRFRGGIAGICDVAPTATREQELDMLKQRAEYFKTAGEEISVRIKELETSAKSE
jgi:hypothetical protein